MRGKVCDLTIIRVHHGITPACAWKRHCPRSRPGRIRDHPRVCGEKPGGRLRELVYPGSPPRMRGKGLMDAELSNAVGITPACAGKSAAQSLDRLCAGDHPRVCGEKSLERFRSGLGLGSPPRMRGKGGGLPRPRFGGGITPAYAGKRLKRSHSIGHFSCILGLFHSVLHRASVSGGSRAGPCAPPCLPAQNAVPV